MLVIMTCVVGVIMRLGFGQHLIEFAFGAFHVDGDAVVFGGARGDTVHEVGAAGLVRGQTGLTQRKMRSTAALM